MTNKELIRRICAGGDVTHLLDIQSAESRSDFRAWMMRWASEGNDAARIALAHYDQAMKDLDSGVMGARSTWHAISPAQRRTLIEASKRRLEPKRGESSNRAGEPRWIIRIATLRNLCSRDLLAWDGGAFDPEAAVVITERGRFVLAHGQTS